MSENEKEILHAIALSLTPRMGLVGQRMLMEKAGGATAVFEHRHEIRDLLPDASPSLVQALQGMEAQLPRAEREMEWAAGKRVRHLVMGSEDYPSRLTHCEDAPIVLHMCGNANLNTHHVVSVVGTRRISENGKDICREFVAELARLCPGTLVVSGLAYGVDIHIHEAALEAGLPTVAVLAHGLDQVYPRMHTATARHMTEQGGLVTEYVSHTNADKRNFVQRNRIVAGMCDAAVVVESALKGGSLITASLAGAYNREVFAFPGRPRDEYSQGCNELIRMQKAQLITSAAHLVDAMQWVRQAERHRRLQNGIQQQLFVELAPEERQVLESLRQCDKKPINLIATDTGIPISRLSGILFEMEMKAIVRMLPGGMYRLV